MSEDKGWHEDIRVLFEQTESKGNRCFEVFALLCIFSIMLLIVVVASAVILCVRYYTDHTGDLDNFAHIATVTLLMFVGLCVLIPTATYFNSRNKKYVGKCNELIEKYPWLEEVTEGGYC